MKGIGAFLGANLFLLAVVLIAAASAALVWLPISALHLSLDAEAFLIIPAGILALVLTFYASRALHRFVDKALNPNKN